MENPGLVTQASSHSPPATSLLSQVVFLVSWYFEPSQPQSYIMAKNNVQSVSYLLCTQVIKPQIMHKPQNQS